MKKIVSFVIVFALSTVTLCFAHGGNEHVRGTVTQISAGSITVQTADKKSHTLTVNGKTAFKQGAKTVHQADVKVGDRVVVDVPEKTTEALLVQIGTAPAPAP